MRLPDNWFKTAMPRPGVGFMSIDTDDPEVRMMALRPLAELLQTREWAIVRAIADGQANLHEMRLYTSDPCTIEGQQANIQAKASADAIQTVFDTIETLVQETTQDESGKDVTDG